jgi:RNA polymerase sigma factor (sigma-70 family)
MRYEVDEITNYYKENYKRMKDIARNKTQKNHCAEEVVQETFLRAIKYYHNYSPAKGSLNDWMNGVFSSRIKEWQRGAMLQGGNREIRDDDIISNDTVGEDNKMLVEIKEMINRIKTPLIRQICYLSFIQGYTPREIEQVVGSKGSYIRNCIWLFKKDLRVVYG